MKHVRRIAEEEYILVVLLAGFGLIFLLIFPPALVVNDSWLNLMAGREVVENGLPSRDEITVYGLGATWTDQQWLAQVLMYGIYSLGGFALLSLATATFVVAAFSIAAAAARWLGAGARAIWVMFLPVLVAAPWAWSIRAQMLALPLYTGLLWLLASEARKPTRRIWLALPLLVVWANVHGSVALGALLVMLLAVYELIRSRGTTWARDLALLVLAPLAVLATPYGPVETARYYHLLLVDPPFAGRVTEWRWAAPATNTMFFYVLAAIAVVLVVLGRRRLTVFDFAVLGLTFVGGVNAIRGIVWFALACMVFVPVAIGHKLEAKRRGEPRRRLNVGIAVGLTVAVLAVAGVALRPRRRVVRGVLAARRRRGRPRRARPDDRVFAPDRFSDWMLFKIPELRGRVAYDVRFELYDREFYRRASELRLRGRTPTGSRSPTATASSSSTRRRRSHTPDFLAEPGARVVYRDDEITVIVRARRLEPTARFRNTSTPSRSNTFSHAGSLSSSAANLRTRPGRRVRSGESGRTTHGSRDRRRPTSPAEIRDRIDVPPVGQVRSGRVRRRHRDIVGHDRDGVGERGSPRSGHARTPPSGVAPTARPHGPTTSESVAEQTSIAAAASPRRGAPIFAMPKTVAAIRNGITAATLWYRGSVIERKSESLFARSCGSATSARPGREHEQEEQREPEPEDVDDVVRLGERAEHRGRVVDERADDSLRRPADLVVEAEEDALVARVVTDDDVDGEGRPRSPAAAIAAPASRRPRASANQTPRPAIGSPMSSPVDIASAAKTANGTSLSVSRNQMQKRKNGIANVTGWIAATALVPTHGYAR